MCLGGFFFSAPQRQEIIKKVQWEGSFFLSSQEDMPLILFLNFLFLEHAPFFKIK